MNQVNCPKKKRTLCVKCGKHQIHNVSQYKKGKDSLYVAGMLFCFTLFC